MLLKSNSTDSLEGRGRKLIAAVVPLSHVSVGKEK